MLRLCAMGIMGVALGYFMYFTRLEGRSLASHLGDIWQSSVVQDKVRMVGREGSRALQKNFSEVVPEAARDITQVFRKATTSPSQQITLGDDGLLAAQPEPPSSPVPPPFTGPPRPASRRAPPHHRAHSSKDRRALDHLVQQLHRPAAAPARPASASDPNLAP